MSIIQFNVAEALAIPIIDLTGNAITNPQPIVWPGIQSLDLNFSGNIQNLMAEKQFAISGIRGDYVLEGKIKSVESSAEIIAELFTGQGYDSTTAFEQVRMNFMVPNISGGIIIPPATPSLGAELYIVASVSYPGSGLSAILGSNYTSGVGLQVVDQYNQFWGARVTTIPAAAGEWYYGPSHITGLGDICFSFYFPEIFPNYPTNLLGGRTPFISFTTNVTSVSSGYFMKHLKVTNVIAGATPVLKLIIATSFQGRKLTLILPYIVTTDFNMLSLRNLEFSGYELSFQCYPDMSSEELLLEGFFIE